MKQEVFAFPMSFSQKRLWFLEQLTPGRSVYNICRALKLKGRLDIGALEHSLNEIVRRHEIMRTTFSSVEGEPVQIVSPPFPFKLPIEDLRHIPEIQREELAKQRLTEVARLPFDLARGPLFRVLLLQLDEDHYNFLVTMHHIISDGWSLGVFERELTALYEAFIERLPSPLDELSIQYADYTIWQREWLQGEVMEEELAYWKKQLSNISTLLLPTDRPRPAIQSDRGEWEFIELGKSLTDALITLSRREGVTLFMTLLTAFKILLNRYTGQHDIIVGSPIANRNQVELENLIGFFINMLALRSDLSDYPTFRELLLRVSETTRTAYDHQYLPFEKLVAELHPDRNLIHTPLFQVAFVLQNMPRERLEIAGLTVSSLLISSGTAKYDLMLSLIEQPTGLCGALEYNTDLFERSTIIRILGNFQTLLNSVVASPDCRISQLSLLTDEEILQVLKEWNTTATDYPRHSSIQELFELQVKRAPEAVAVVFKDRQLTYSQLNERANQLAHHLRSLCVKKGSLVAVCLERSLEMVISMLGILKAGGAYVPLDVSYPAQRLSFMLQDTGSNVLLTREGLLDLFSNEGVQVVRLDRDKDIINTQPVSDPEMETGGDDLAYVMYTSGSTGTPKGVEILHRGVVRLLFGVDYVNLCPEETLLQLAPISFDASTFEIWGALLHGGCCVIFPSQVPSHEELGDVIERYGVSTLWLTASLFNMIISESPQILRGVKQLLTGGEALSVPHIRQALEYLPSTQLINGYGPTESTTFTCCYPIPKQLPEGLNSIPIGRPIANTQVYVLDSQMKPVPVGVPGELYIGGDGLARGYLNHPGLTAERFVNDPFSEELGSRLYRTGDMVRWLPEGILEFLGRKDNQIKLRGFRIELGEIESVLRNHESVEEAVVLLREDEPGYKRLAGYIVPRANEAFSLEDLRAYLKSKLPEYMIPAFFVQMETLPLTPNCKVDKKALPAPDTYSMESSTQLVEPRTPIEQALVEIWSDVLRRDGIGIQDNFFNLGGHSLLATQVISRVSETFEILLPVAELFEHPTVSEFAEEMESRMHDKNLERVPQIKPVERKAEIPLSFAQQRLWFISQLELDSPLYNISMAMELKGQLDKKALQKGLNELFRRHESLRTRFDLMNGQSVQLIDPPWQVDIPVMDLSEVADSDRESEVHRLLREESLRPFDLKCGPLLRVKLLCITDTDHILLITMHHIVSDGWSLGIFFRELAVLYESYTKGRSSPLSELPVQYADFALWQREWLSGQVMDSQMSYWREQLSGELSVLNLPTDYPRPAIQTFNGASQSIHLSRELSESLKALSHREHVTIFMTLLSAFKVLIHRYTGQEDIIVGSPVANRNRAETEGLIGFFVNMLVLRSRVSGTQSFRELLSQVRKTTLGAYTHQDLPFEKLVDEFETDRDLSRSALFQVTFTFQNTPVKPMELEGLQIKQIEMECQTTRFDLEVHVWERDGQLRIFFFYNRDLFAQSTIERMMKHYRVLLEGIVSDPECWISRLPLMSESERHKLLEVWNQTQTDYPRQSSIPELFELQVQRDPNAVAVVFKDKQLTYSKLNESANQLAHHLRSMGVRQGSLVAVCLKRSVEMVISMLGILKAGGAYVPLDVGYPSQRLSFMLKDTEANILLTHEDLLDRFSCDGVQVVCLDRDGDLIKRQPVFNPELEVCGDDLAYVMYTSGSTGTPKGVEILHRGIVRLVCNTDYIKLGPKDRIAHITNYSFDVSTFEVWGPLLSGARLVVLDQETVLSPKVLVETLQTEGISVVLLTTAVFNLLAKESPQVLAGIENIFFGGEAADPQWVRKVADEKGPGRLLNAYGPTENTTITTVYEVSSMPKDQMTVPIGSPIANTKVYVLDNQMKPVPVGVPGELYIGGDGLARGYLNRPELTAEMFVNDPFSEEPVSRLYRTGDMVRWLPEGILEFLGRIDNQVKLRGFRIELGEIETHLRTYELVEEAVVLLREDEPGDKRLIGYVVPRANVSFSLEDLRAYLRQGLPDYMVPSYFMQLESLPLTPNGKVDRKALPAPGGQRQLKETYVQPKTKLERSIANIWQDVLKIDRVGIHDNFFDLGGNSLLMILVRSKLTEITKIDIPMIDLFRYPTIGTLASYLRKEKQELSDIVDDNRIIQEVNRGKSRLKSQLYKSKKLRSGGTPYEQK